MVLKENKEGYMGTFVERKGKGEMYFNRSSKRNKK